MGESNGGPTAQLQPCSPVVLGGGRHHEKVRLPRHLCSSCASFHTAFAGISVQESAGSTLLGELLVCKVVVVECPMGMT